MCIASLRSVLFFADCLRETQSASEPPLCFNENEPRKEKQERETIKRQNQKGKTRQARYLEDSGNGDLKAGNAMEPVAHKCQAMHKALSNANELWLKNLSSKCSLCEPL